MSSGLLDGLDGIDEARNVQAISKTNLEKLLELEKPFMECYLKRTTEIRAVRRPKNEMDKVMRLKEIFILETLFPEFEKRCADIHFDETDLINYVITRCNDADHTPYELKARGLYTGFLLNLFTKRCEIEGKRAVIHLDGKGNRFDYLFYLAQNVHELYLENLRGDCSCHYLGYKGKIDKLIARNIDGWNTCTSIGVMGNSNKVICVNLSYSHSDSAPGSVPLQDAFAAGYCDVFILSNIEGQIVLDRRIKGARRCRMVICDNIRSESFFEEKLKLGDLGLVVINEIAGGSGGRDTASSDITYSGLDQMNVNTILFSNVPEDIASYLNGLYTISARQVCTPPEPEYNLEMRRYRMPEIMNLLKKFREGEKDMRTFMTEFDKVYASVEPEIQKLSRR